MSRLGQPKRMTADEAGEHPAVVAYCAAMEDASYSVYARWVDDLTVGGVDTVQQRVTVDQELTLGQLSEPVAAELVRVMRQSPMFHDVARVRTDGA